MAAFDNLIKQLSRELAPAERRAALRSAELSPEQVRQMIRFALKTRSEKPHVAERLARSAALVARTAGEERLSFHARKVLAQTHIVLGQPRRALRLLSTRPADLTPHENAAVSLDLAQTLSLLGRREDALSVLQVARAQLPKKGAERSFAFLAAGEAHMHCTAGRPERGLACLDEALAGLREHGTEEQRLSLESNRANALRELGRVDEAESLYRTIIPLMEGRGLRPMLRMARLNLALIDIGRGRFHAVLRELATLREQFEAAEDQSQVAECNLREAEVNLALHLPTQAMDHAVRADQALRGLGLTDKRAEAKYLAGVAARGLGRNAEAVARLEAAHRVFDRPGGEACQAAVCLVRLAETDRHLGELGRAAQRLHEAIPRLRDLGWHERATRAEALLAQIEREAGEPHNARRRLYALLEGPHTPRTPWVRCDLHHQLGVVEETVGRLRPALRHILTATRILERYRVGIPPDEYMAAFLTSRAQLFEDAVRIVLFAGGTGAAIRAFELSEQARARALLDLMRSRTPTEKGRSASPLHQEADALEREIEGHLAPTGREKAANQPALGPQRAEILSDRESRLRACLDQLALEDPEEVRRRRGAPLRFRELVTSLPEDVLLLEYYLTRDEIHIWGIRRDGIRHVRKPMGHDERARLLSRMRFQLDRPNVELGYREDAQDALLHSAGLVLEELDALLLGDFRDDLDVRRVVVVPNGELHGVPFAALQRDGVALIEEVEVLVQPSAAVYLHCLRTPTATGPALLMGFQDRHAPEIEAEIQGLGARLEPNNAFIGPRATIAAFETHGPQARIIHLAAHTEYRHDDSMASRLRLADGWLTVPQIYAMRIAPELLVLSGCATGRVSVTRGGDLFGLVRGFLHAGARSILSSLWEVSDSRTPEYMERFYAAYGDGMTAAAAMRQATLDMRAAHPHPYHWAPFLLTGRGS